MTREEAISVLDKALYSSERAREAANMAIEALSANAEWIPCSERLPKEYAQYLVYFGSGECYVYWLEDSDWARGMTEKEDILAWMPLPEPYKGGDTE